MRIVVLATVVAAGVYPQSLTVGWISDHGVCVPHGINGNGPRTTQCDRQAQVAAMIERWNPDFIVSTGDMSNIRGNRAETYKGILVRSANAVVAPTSTTSTLLESVVASSSPQTVRVSTMTPLGYYALNFDQANAEVIQVLSRTATAPYTIRAIFLREHRENEPLQANSQTIEVDPAATDCDGTTCMMDLNLFGVSPQKLMFVNTLLGIDEDAWDRFETVKVTAVPDATHFTATFARSHPASSIIRGSAHTPYLRWIKAGRFLPTPGNHDYGGGEWDWCVNGTQGCEAATGNSDRFAFNEYWQSTAAGQWPLNGNAWFAKEYGSLITFFSLDSTGRIRRGDVQETEMTPRMNSCATRWCVTLMHHPMYGDFDGRRIGGPGPQRSNYLWMANDKIDVVLSGHAHLYHRYTARNDAGRMIPYVTAGISGDALESTRDTSCERYGDCIVDFPSWWASYGAGKITVSSTELKVEVFSLNNPAEPIDTLTLNKPPQSGRGAGRQRRR